ncbi:MAG: aspartate aminotransferase family protein [bacterium (Candidatus Ratteibacteria) CG23_combo_of_CG06-09_8_20_14_all_48_7]|uniref:Aspartate aminotransferase family protein n=1 Tax=bacterium (Candidatus Ratteibacteria) CG23_combo_of_CG06-09_8_20_14_all_48_7 TaxID=2014292 RepID=A0A2G9YBB4_9BACT|nr:MAG: aspartate aminotransferase family protein [bacterium (Candidatus Ratteibacteria) CG23_combo_of_CG06-09_8_20_14_all_48_7]
MGLQEFALEPKEFPPVETPFRRVKTKIPVPESVPFFKRLWASEPRSMHCEPPIIWEKARGVNIFDPYGNKWLDWSCGVLVTNVGHNHPKIIKALQTYLKSGGPLHSYIFANQARAKLVEKLLSIVPKELDRVFLLTTGSEAVEVALKVSRTAGIRQNPKKRYVISFEGGFHGRTYASQLAGGALGGGEWVDQNPYFIQIPFPGSIETKDKSFSFFEKSLQGAGIKPEGVSAVISETFQGREGKLMPKEYALSLRKWCDHYKTALIFDEVQAGFGRTGKLFGFEHCGVVPDLFVCGKGISSSLPLSAVIGKSAYLDLYGPGEMTSTHTGSPLPAVAALASIETLLEENLIRNADRLGKYLQEQLKKITAPYQNRIDVGGCGLVAGMLFFQDRQSLKPDPESAFRFCKSAVGSGNLFFSPVGKGRGTIKFCPPLCITREAIDDGIYGARGLAEILKEIM